MAKVSLTLPVKIGGLGLRKVSQISLPAYFCAASNAAPDILSSLDEKAAITFLPSTLLSLEKLNALSPLSKITVSLLV